MSGLFVERRELPANDSSSPAKIIFHRAEHPTKRVHHAVGINSGSNRPIVTDLHVPTSD
jgi:hypothetical protein